MGLEKFWSEHFKISEQQVLEWKEIASSQKESLILWVLKNKKIDPQAYHQWSFEKYQIPRLKISFFQKNKINKELLGRCEHWPDHVFPIKEDANKNFYLACLEPVSSFTLPQKIQWILAPIEGILAWKAENTPLTNLSSNNLDTQSYTEDAANPELEALNNMYSQVDIKKGLDQVNFSNIKVAINETPKPQNVTKTTQEPSKSHSVTKASQSNIQSLHNPKKIASPHKSVKASQPKQPQPSTSTPPSNLHVLPVEPKSSAPSSKQPEQTNNRQQNPKEGGTHTEILQSLSEFFDKGMILLLKNAILRPWKWDSTWTQQQSNQNMILLNKPSIFQIVYKTRQKYHGYVVANDINDAFFQAWNYGNYPEHITILPLIVNKSLRGMLLGITSAKKGKSLSLDRLDILALEVSQKMTKVA